MSILSLQQLGTAEAQPVPPAGGSSSISICCCNDG